MLVWQIVFKVLRMYLSLIQLDNIYWTLGMGYNLRPNNTSHAVLLDSAGLWCHRLVHPFDDCSRQSICILFSLKKRTKRNLDLVDIPWHVIGGFKLTHNVFNELRFVKKWHVIAVNLFRYVGKHIKFKRDAGTC